jgi:hypothetical protein
MVTRSGSVITLEDNGKHLIGSDAGKNVSIQAGEWAREAMMRHARSHAIHTVEPARNELARTLRTAPPRPVQSNRALLSAQPKLRLSPSRQGGLLQRKCACDGSGEPCAACSEKEDGLQRAAQGAGSGSAGIAPPIVHDVLRSPGQPLEPAARSLMEQRFATDFAAVRVHTDARASQSAEAVNALAYTVGRNIVFQTGQYSPDTDSGRGLLAHELTHVVQQQGVNAAPREGSLEIASPSSALEEEATAAEASATMSPSGAQKEGLQRMGKVPTCGGTWSCAASPCADPQTPATKPPSTSWKLTAMIDTEAPSPEDVTKDTFGHTYVQFSESSGAVYTYGFYPHPTTIPDTSHTKVFGCVVHPDMKHEPCVDYKEEFTLAQAEYDKALKFAQGYCAAPLNYDLYNNNCTTFVVDVVKQAGKTLPPVRGKVSLLGITADNPNTLLEGLRDRDRPTRHLTSDTEIRNWVHGHSSADVGGLPADEKLRLINRLLNGYVAEGDVSAIEKLCGSVTSATEMSAIKTKIEPRVKELYNTNQANRVRAAINRTP